MRKHSSFIYREIFKNAADGILVVDSKGRIIDANKAYSQMTGYTLRELLSIRLADLRIDSPEKIRQEMEEVQRMGYMHLTAMLRKKDGSLFSVEASLSFIRSGGGLFYAFIRNVTSRKEVERIREEYAALIAHDLRNPLQTITLRISQLKHGLKHDDLKRNISAMESACAKIDSMISEIAETARLEAVGFNPSDKHPVDLNRLISRIIRQEIPHDRQHRMRYFAPGEALWVMGEENHLSRVVVNLITNAFKYSPPGKPVDIYLEKEKKEVFISIKDYGEGINGEDLPHIFERFYRSKGAETRHGFGLGLYITRLIVEAHGGQISVQSKPKDGSIFSVSLPLL